jgi:hypothetical protein
MGLGIFPPTGNQGFDSFYLLLSCPDGLPSYAILLVDHCYRKTAAHVGRLVDVRFPLCLKMGQTAQNGR